MAEFGSIKSSNIRYHAWKKWLDILLKRLVDNVFKNWLFNGVLGCIVLNDPLQRFWKSNLASMSIHWSKKINFGKRKHIKPKTKLGKRIRTIWDPVNIQQKNLWNIWYLMNSYPVTIPIIFVTNPADESLKYLVFSEFVSRYKPNNKTNI